MTATLALDSRTLDSAPAPEPQHGRPAGKRRQPVLADSGERRAGAGSDASEAGRPVLRIRPVPRSEPPSDDERVAGLAGGPAAIRALPADLATGVRVRRDLRRRVEAGASGPVQRRAGASTPVGGAAAGADTAGGEPTPPPRPTTGRRTAGPGPDAPPARVAGSGTPAVLRTPEAVMAIVTTSLHASSAPPGQVPLGQSSAEAALGVAEPDGPAASNGPATPGAPAGGPWSAEGGHTPMNPAAAVTVVAPGLGNAQPVATTPRGGLDLRVSARRLLATCVEVLGGFRPVAQLRPYCAPERFDAIANRLLRPMSAGRGHGATRSSLIASRLTPRPGRPARITPADRIVVRRVQICDVMEGIAELVVVMARHNKVWAMTLRMEHTRGKWMCMHLEVL